MNSMKNSFIRLAIQNQVLKFGQFTLKSGRISPYFFNAGLFYSGTAMATLGTFYAKTLIHHKVHCTHLFGPAYKGIPLVTATAVALAHHGIETSITFNRKEAKSHGEGGILIGSPLTGDTIMIDDVITAGTAFREAEAIIATHGGRLTTVLIALDRRERSTHTTHSTVMEIEAEGIQVLSIITIHDILDYLKKEGDKQHVQAIEQYLKQYGCD